MFFPADITHLRFPSSQAVQQLERDDAIPPIASQDACAIHFSS